MSPPVFVFVLKLIRVVGVMFVLLSGVLVETLEGVSVAVLVETVNVMVVDAVQVSRSAQSLESRPPETARVPDGQITTSTSGQFESVPVHRPKAWSRIEHELVPVSVGSILIGSGV